MNTTTNKQDSNNSRPRVALVTGGSARIGANIVSHLHGLGMNLVVHYRHSRDTARALQEKLNETRADSVVLVQGDLQQVAKLENLIEQTHRAFGNLDVLINNASAFYPTPVGQTDESAWHDLMDTNLKAPFFLMQAAAPYLKASKGCVVNITDIYADRPLADHPVYCAAKAGLVSLTKSMARELSPEVRVNAISPGAILWPSSGGDELSRQRIISHTPMKKMGTPEDIAQTVEYLIHNAPYITGQVIAIDGGRSIAY